MIKPRFFINTWLLAALVALGLNHPATAAEPIDLSKAVVVVPDGLSGPEHKATRLLVEEVRNRSQLEWNVSLRWPTDDVPVIAVGPGPTLIDSFPRELRERMPGLAAGTEKEGFHIDTALTRNGPAVVAVIGNDERGVLFGVGRLLRELRAGSRHAALPDLFNLTSAPKYPLRGHQLGYRPKTNSYDAWDLPQWERYIRDLAVFGTNAIELIPPRSDDDGRQPPLSAAAAGNDDQACRRSAPTTASTSGSGTRPWTPITPIPRPSNTP